jgi:hypothetical protein
VIENAVLEIGWRNFKDFPKIQFQDLAFKTL